MYSFNSYLRLHIIFGKGDASMYIIFSAIIRIGVAFFDFHNGIINLLE